VAADHCACLGAHHSLAVDRPSTGIDHTAQQPGADADTRLLAQSNQLIAIAKGRIRLEQHDQRPLLVKTYNFPRAGRPSGTTAHLTTLADIRDRPFRFQPLAVGFDHPAAPRQYIQASQEFAVGAASE
jgi:hypothetical protein